MKTKLSAIAITQTLIILSAFTAITIAQETENEIQWPTSWNLIESDPTENGASDDFRDVRNALYNVDDEYLYLRLECYASPNFKSEPDGRYKWFIDIDDPHNMGQSGGNVFDAEYLLFIEDSPKPGGDGVGDIYLLEDLDGDGFIGDDYSDYLVSPGKITNSSIASYRIEGNCIDVCIKLTEISNPINSYFTWATDQENPNIDQAPEIDRSNDYWDTDLSKADLSIVKTDSADPISPGDSFTYSLLVTNHGPHIAYNINVTDEIPANLVFNSATPSASGGSLPNLFWNIPSLTVGESYEILINVTVSTSVTGLISNTAFANNDTRDPVAGNNYDTEETTVIETADLSLIESDSADPVYPGDSFTYNLHILNNGVYAAENVVIVDYLPAGLSLISAGPTPSDVSGSKLTWNLASLAVGSSMDISILVSVDNIASTVVTNNAEVSSDTFDPTSANNAASETTTINVAADLSISKSSDLDSLYPGDALTYTVVLSNNGPDVSTAVNVSDMLPDEVSFVSASPSPTGNSGSLYFWNFASLANAESETITIDVLVGSSSSGILTNNVEVSSDTYDPLSENNMASKAVAIGDAADLSIEKTASTNAVIVGEELNYSIMVTNNGPHTAEYLLVSDNLPSDVTFLSADPAPSGNTGQTYYWNLVSLNAGESFEIQINVSADAMGTIVNTAQVTSDTYDLSPFNNENSVETYVTGIADLSIEKTSEFTEPLYAGDLIIYYLNVTNHGPDIALNVNVTDILPNGVTFSDSNLLPSGNNGSKYWWIISSMDVNESIIIRVNVTVNQGFSGKITNIATVKGDYYDPYDDNDEDDEDVIVDKEEDDDNGGGGNSDDENPDDGNPGNNLSFENKEPTAKTDGPYYATLDEEIQFNATESHDNDENGESIVRYDWKFSDEDEWRNDSSATPTHTYNRAGKYNVTLRVFDNENSSNINTTFVFITKLNSPPGQLELTGPENGTKNVSYNFTVVSTDEDGDHIKYIIDWGDGNTTKSGFLPSGIPFKTSYKWKDSGEYKIKITADDNSTNTTEDFTIEINEPEPDKKEAEEGNILLPLILLLLLFLVILLLLLDKRRRDKKKGEQKLTKTTANQSAKPKIKKTAKQ